MKLRSDPFEALVDSFGTTDETLVTKEETNILLNKNYELDLQIKQMIEKTEDLWKCKLCGRTSAQKINIQNHAETHIGGIMHSCPMCSKTVSTRHNLRSHVSTMHSELFSCDICGKSGMRRGAYRVHMMKKHQISSAKQ